MRDWIPWRSDEPRSLTRYVLPGEVGHFLQQLPGPSGDSPWQRLQTVYEAIAGKEIRYAHEPPSRDTDRQEIRGPEEVLWAPRHATCLDLAIIFAGACLTAGLDPLIVLTERVDGRFRHALLGVWMQERPAEAAASGGVWQELPAWLPGRVRSAAGDADQPLVMLDPVGASRALPSSPDRGVSASFDEAVAAGAQQLLGDEWRWSVGVDVGQVWRESDTYRPAARFTIEPLRRPYPYQAQQAGLQSLRAEFRVVPFQAREELTVLRHWCQQAAAGTVTGLVVIDGVGGSGKTRLVLELADKLADQGWYAGLLRDRVQNPSWEASVEWLAGVISPSLIIVDYADARVEETKVLMRALMGRSAPAVVVLTARTVEGEWLPQIQGLALHDGHVMAQRRVALPPNHPDGSAIAGHAAAAFTGSRAKPPEWLTAGAKATVPSPEHWTTLDYVLLGWLAARGQDNPPKTRAALYSTVLVHEERYWANVYRDRAGDPRPRVLRRAAVCLTLLAPTSAEAGQVLRSVPELTDAAEWRESIREVLTECFRAGPGEVLALRPDPVADYLAVQVLSDDPDLLDQCLNSLDNARLPYALANLNRAGGFSPSAVTDLLAGWLRRHPNRWRALLVVAAAQTGSALAAFEKFIRERPVLPLDEVAEAIPLRHIQLVPLGLAVETWRLDVLRGTGNPDPAALAEQLEQLGYRQSATGDVDGALASVTEVVQIRRDLAADSPTSNMPGLATSLINLAAAQHEGGYTRAALASATEAVGLYRELAADNPADHESGLAHSLNIVSVSQNQTGDPDTGLRSATEAVGLYRELAADNRADHLPGLASSLINLAAAQHETGDPRGTLGSATEAVAYYRELASTGPSAYLPDLAKSLIGLSISQVEVGDQQDALASASEAVYLYRVLAPVSPVLYLPELAAALLRLYPFQSDTGDWGRALDSATELVGILRGFVEDSQADFLPVLARSLNNLSAAQGETGDWKGALGSAREVVGLYRDLEKASPGDHLADLADSLTNLAGAYMRNGDLNSAVGSENEATGLYRDLAEDTPTPYRSNLADSLARLGMLQNATGDWAGALTSATETVGLYRNLEAASPGDHLPGLANSLTNLAGAQNQTGDLDEAVGSAAEAVRIWQALGEASPADHMPFMANSLDSLAMAQNRAGDLDGALGSAAEAVRTWRALARENPTEHLPGLAHSLTVCGMVEGASNDWGGALASFTIAVGLHRELAAASPAAHLSALANSLTNLAAAQKETGDPDGAVSSAGEAVGIWRGQPEASRAGHMRFFANSLSGLAAAMGESDPDGALGFIEEAHGIYQKLAGIDPIAYRPDLAQSLTYLGVGRLKNGDPYGALGPANEAVGLYRELAKANPGAYLPQFANALNNQAASQFQAGNKDQALQASAEMVGIWQSLADASPAVHQADLVRALTVDSLMQRSLGSEDDGRWLEAIGRTRAVNLRAGLRAQHARLLARRGDRAAAIDQLATAATEAATDDPQILRPARQLINAAAAEMDATDPRLPAWATTKFPSEHIALLMRWAKQRAWPDVESLLAEHAQMLLSDGFRASMALAPELFPGDPLLIASITKLLALLAEVERRGLAAVLTSGRDSYNCDELVRAWGDTPNWDDSARFLQEHYAELVRPEVRTLLSASDNHAGRQHLAILDLAGRVPLERVCQIVASTKTATEYALDVVENADSDLLMLLVAAVPMITRQGIAGTFIRAALALTLGEHNAARCLAQEIADRGDPIQREALALRLRAFAGCVSDPAIAYRLAHIIAPELSTDLRDRLADASPLTEALILSVTDWSRTGLSVRLPEVLAEELWIAYLPQELALELQNKRPDNRHQHFADAIAWACEPIPGTTARLVTLNDDGLLADEYLIAQRTEARQAIARAVWQAAVNWALAAQDAASAEALAYSAATADVSDIAQAAWEWLAASVTEAAPAAARNLGLLLQRAGDFEGSRVAYQQAIESRDPVVAFDAALGLALMLKEQGDTAGAQAVYQEAIDTGDPRRASTAAIKLALMLEEQGHADGAEAAYRQAIDTDDPENAPDAAVRLGVLLARQGKATEAQAAYQQAIHADHRDHSPIAMVRFGVLLGEQGNAVGERAAYTQAIATRHPEAMPAASLNLGALLQRLEDTTGAQMAYELAIGADHPVHSPLAAGKLGEMLEGQGQMTQAQVAYQRAIDADHPDHSPLAAGKLGEMLEGQGQMTQAEAAYQRAIDADHPDHSPLAAGKLGEMLEGQGQMTQAQAAYQRAIDADHADHSPPAAIRLGMMLESHGDLAGAQAAYQRAIDADHADHSPLAAILSGRLRAQQGDIAGARTAYQEAISTNPFPYTSSAEFILLGEQCMAEDSDARRAHRDRVAASGDAGVLVGLAQLYALEGDLNSARSLLERAVNAGVTSADNYLELLGCEEGSRVSSLTVEAVRAGADAGDTDSMNFLGLHFLALGAPEEARSWWARSLAAGDVIADLLITKTDAKG